MSFPFSITGNVVVPCPANDAELIERIVAATSAGLEQARGRHIRRDGTGVTFRGGIFRAVGSWNPTYGVSSGKVVVASLGKHVEVAYHLRITEIVVIATIAALWLFAVFILSLPDITTAMVAAVSTGLWIFIVAANYLLIRLQFQRWLRKLAEASKRADNRG